ncbi:MAG: hypothetical protein U1F46_08855 [Marinagarivorans sp.]
MQITNLSPTPPPQSSHLRQHCLNFLGIFTAINISGNNNRVFTRRKFNRLIVTFIGGARHAACAGFITGAPIGWGLRAAKYG